MGWTLIHKLVGDAGPAGANGVAGATGATGPSGVVAVTATSPLTLHYDAPTQTISGAVDVSNLATTGSLQAVYNSMNLAIATVQQGLIQFEGRRDNPHQVTASQLASGTLDIARLPDLGDKYLSLTRGVSYYSGTQLYLAKKPLATPSPFSVDRATDGQYEYLDYVIYVLAPDGQVNYAEASWDDTVGSLNVTLPEGIVGYSYQLWRYRDNSGQSTKLGDWTALTMPDVFVDDLSLDDGSGGDQPAYNLSPLRLYDNAANALELDGVSVTAASFHGNGAGLSNLPSPFNQQLNTSNSPMFSGLTLRSAYSYSGAISNLLTLQSYDPYGVHTQLQINNVGQMVMQPFFQNSDAIGVQAYGLSVNPFYNQDGNRPAATILVNHAVLKYGSGRCVFADFQEGGATLFAIDRFGRLQWTTNASEGLIRNSSGALQYTDTSGYTATISKDAVHNSLTLADDIYGVPVRKTITFEPPLPNQNTAFIQTDKALTVTKVVCVVTGGTTASNFTIKASTDRSSAGTTILAGSTSNKTTGDTITTFSTTSIPAGSWVWITTDGTAHTATSLSITLEAKQ